jgi:hypothetical protein
MSESLSKPTLPTFSWIGHLKDDDRDLLSSYGEFFPILRARVGPGETLGEISLFDPGPATATVTAAEFSQLWRIADEDLIQFMDDNPGAGNVLLRTLAAILAQRLRRTDPEAFGLSAYAVVDSPELKDVPPPAAVEPPEIPAEVVPVPVSDLTPIKTAAPLAPEVAAPGAVAVVPEVKSNKKTQPFVDPARGQTKRSFRIRRSSTAATTASRPKRAIPTSYVTSLRSLLK